MRENNIIGVDFHVHTEASGDAANTLKGILGLLQQRFYYGDLLGVAITDHNTINPEVFQLGEMGVPIIVGEEIKTGSENPNNKEIEIVALRLRESINPGKSMGETLYQINQQGGVVVIPHPYDLWRHGAGDEWSEWIINFCLHENIPVAVEVCNARASCGSNQKAERLWEEFKNRGVLRTAGSDAHWGGEVGRVNVQAHVVVPFFRTREGLLKAMAGAEIERRGNIFATAGATAGHRFINRALVALLRMKHK